MPGNQQPIVIRRRWWADVIALGGLPVLAFLANGMAHGIFDLIAEGSWWRAALLSLCAAVFALSMVLIANGLFGYRVELVDDGLLIVANFYTVRLLWSEITEIKPRHNYRLPGYHVQIQVDGSIHPTRHWSNFGFRGYFIAPLMERGGKDLTRYLLRKRNEWRRRSAASLEQD